MSPDDRWLIARHRMRAEMSGLFAVWGFFLIAVMSVVLFVSLFREIEVSGWEIGSQIPRWYLGAIGVYATSVYLPLYIAHGYTRRETTRQLAVVAAAAVVVASLLMTVGYAVERGVYAVAGWPQVLGNQHLYADANAYGAIFGGFLLVFATWLVAGAFVGAAYYRGAGSGTLAIPVVLVAVLVIEGLTSPGFNDLLGVLPWVAEFTPTSELTFAIAAPVALVITLVLAAATWRTVRELPIRSERT